MSTNHTPPSVSHGVPPTAPQGVSLGGTGNAPLNGLPDASPDALVDAPLDPLAIIARHSREGAELRQIFFDRHAATLRDAALRIATALAQGNKLLLCGNGGSAADAQHLAGEFVNRFLLDRPPLPAIALSTDTSVLTAIGNDFGFAQIFAKQVRALGQSGDVLLAISTSGNSPNVLEALRAAREQGLLTVGLTGKDGGIMGGAMGEAEGEAEGETGAKGEGALCDILLDVPHTHTPLVQEVHIAAGHMLCQLIDHFLFENASALAPALKS